MLSRYGRTGASSRMRSFQYIPWLENAGMDVTIAPLFSDTYVQGLQQNVRRKGEILKAYFKRVRVLLASRKFDLIWIEKETLPWLPAWLEKLLLPRHVPFVLDYDDAVFHHYDHHRLGPVRWLLSGKHPALIRRSSLVTAGNAYLAAFASAAGATKVETIPTVINLERYPLAAPEHSTGSSSALPHALPRVGWIGQRSTAEFLVPHADLFKRISAEGAAEFVAIGIDAVALGLPMTTLAWSEDSEVDSINTLDIGIMPLRDGAFEQGKCGYKLIQYMACGLPVIASPVGVNCQIVEDGVNGFLAETPEQWERSLRTLIADADLRCRMGQAGRQKVKQAYALQVTGPVLASLLTELVSFRSA